MSVVFVGFVFFGVLFFVTRSTGTLQPAPSRPGSVQPLHDKEVATTAVSTLNEGARWANATSLPTRPTGIAAGNEIASEGIIDRDPARESYFEHLLSEVDPQDRTAFEHSLKLMGGGNYAEARRGFHEIIEKNPGTALEAAAHWCLGLAYYMEGGTENLYLAAGRFADLVAHFNNLEPEVFVEAAQIDLAIVCMELMYLVSTEQERIETAKAAAGAFKTFLDRWPDNVQAAAARGSLFQVQDYLSGTPQ